MNAGVTSITALMAKTDLDGEVYVAEYGEEEYVKLVAAYSLYIGIASVLLALVGFGKLAQKVPKTVRSGFKVSTFGHYAITKGTKSCTARLYHYISSVYSGVVLSVYLYQLYQTVCLLVVAES